MEGDEKEEDGEDHVEEADLGELGREDLEDDEGVSAIPSRWRQLPLFSKNPVLALAASWRWGRSPEVSEGCGRRSVEPGKGQRCDPWREEKGGMGRGRTSSHVRAVKGPLAGPELDEFVGVFLDERAATVAC